jgi:hypothetical protein
MNPSRTLIAIKRMSQPLAIHTTTLFAASRLTVRRLPAVVVLLSLVERPRGKEMENKTDVKPKKNLSQKDYYAKRLAEGLTPSQLREARTSLPPIVPVSSPTKLSE